MWSCIREERVRMDPQLRSAIGVACHLFCRDLLTLDPHDLLKNRSLAGFLCLQSLLLGQACPENNLIVNTKKKIYVTLKFPKNEDDFVASCTYFSRRLQRLQKLKSARHQSQWKSSQRRHRCLRVHALSATECTKSGPDIPQGWLCHQHRLENFKYRKRLVLPDELYA